MKRKSRYERFEPITVRAAARVLHLGRTGRLAPREARRYVRNLATIDSHAGNRAHHRLRRMALRRSCLGHTGVPSVCQMTRRKRDAIEILPGVTGRSACHLAA